MLLTIHENFALENLDKDKSWKFLLSNNPLYGIHQLNVDNDAQLLVHIMKLASNHKTAINSIIVNIIIKEYSLIK